MIRHLPVLFTLAVTLFGAGQPATKSEVISLTPEQLEKKIAGQKHYDFDIAPDDGLVDSAGKTIHAAELQKYLKAHALASSAAYFLWITSTSAPLNTNDQTVKALSDYGITTCWPKRESSMRKGRPRTNWPSIGWLHRDLT